jgi:hypothetical protein
MAFHLAANGNIEGFSSVLAVTVNRDNNKCGIIHIISMTRTQRKIL